jgi:hypothetical protein
VYKIVKFHSRGEKESPKKKPRGDEKEEHAATTLNKFEKSDVHACGCRA